MATKESVYRAHDGSTHASAEAARKHEGQLKLKALEHLTVTGIIAGIEAPESDAIREAITTANNLVQAWRTENGRVKPRKRPGGAA